MSADTTDTLELLERWQRGDARARDLLVERLLPQLRQWARGRLPHSARTVADTQDLVNDAVLRALPRLEPSNVQHPAALQAYLREVIRNRIADEVRKVRKHPVPDEPREDPPDLHGYQKALETLAPIDRKAIVARIDLRLSYEEIAITLGEPNAEAARLVVERALARLIEAMRHER